MKVGIIGAGPAGLTAAYELAKAGVSVHLFEAEDRVGGLSKTISLFEQKVDLGPHRFFTLSFQVKSFWEELLDGNYSMVDRTTRILFDEKFIQYPLKLGDAFFKLGVLETARCVQGYLNNGKLGTESDGVSSFESWVTSRFGKRLYELFFKAYNEKLWGIPSRKLDSDFAAQRIKTLNISEILKGFMIPQMRSRHRGTVEQFAYPHKGCGVPYEMMARLVEEMGGQIYLSCPAKRVLLHNKRAWGLELNNGQRLDFDEIISTMPLNSLIAGLDGCPENVCVASRKLCFRNTIIVYLEVTGENSFQDQWIYVHSPKFRMGRITNFGNWVPGIRGNSLNTILALEYWTQDDENLWHLPGHALIEMAKNEICRTSLVDQGRIRRGHVERLKYSYPVYYLGYKAEVNLISDWVRAISNLHVIGRYGSYKYNNQDHSILMGMKVARKILSNGSEDLWGINSDYDTYQESNVQRGRTISLKPNLSGKVGARLREECIPNEGA